MNDDEIKARLIDIEMTLDTQSKILEDLSEMVIRQGKMIDYLFKQNEMLRDSLSTDVVKPLSDETPPPHY
ncbi:MAG: SlyX family protein [Alphaproteobacteria bacterium]|nr:SlyX family protein [Alphaproteobacteria bacterium]